MTVSFVLQCHNQWTIPLLFTDDGHGPCFKCGRELLWGKMHMCDGRNFFVMDRALRQCPFCGDSKAVGVQHLCIALGFRCYVYDILLMTSDHDSPIKAALDAESAADAAAEVAAADPRNKKLRAQASTADSEAKRLLRISSQAVKNSSWVHPNDLPVDDVVLAMQMRKFGSRCVFMSEAGVITLFMTNSSIRVKGTPLIGFKVLQPATAVLQPDTDIMRYWGVAGGVESQHSEVRTVSRFNIDDYTHLGLAITWTTKTECFDPTWSGNFGVVNNHSCEPNMELRHLRIAGQGVIKLVLTKPVTGSDEEVTWDYECRCDTSAEEIECCCGSRNCRKKLCALSTAGVVAEQQAEKKFRGMSASGQTAFKAAAAQVAVAQAAAAQVVAAAAAAAAAVKVARNAAAVAATAEAAAAAAAHAAEPRMTRRRHN